jgi:hypothetical protein
MRIRIRIRIRIRNPVFQTFRLSASVAEQKIFLSAPAPRSRKSEFQLRLQPRLQIVL